jgi:hypothetical protein
VNVQPPASWTPTAPTTWQVPGTALEAWSGPEGAAMIVYRSLPIPGGTAEMLAGSLANRLTNLPEYHIESSEVETIAQQPAAKVVVVAQGTGDALAPTGIGRPLAPEGKTLIPTRQVTVGFARSDGAYFLRWQYPESKREQIEPDINAMLSTLRLAPDTGAPTQSY